MVSALDSGSSNPGQGHCVVFMGKTLHSHNNAGGNPAMDEHPIHGGVEIFLVALCYRNWDKLRLSEPLDSYADFTFSMPL